MLNELNIENGEKGAAPRAACDSNRSHRKPSSNPRLMWIFMAIAAGIAAVLLLRNASQFDFRAAMATASSISALQMLSILLMAAGSYTCLTFFDWLALKYLGHRLRYHQAALASFTALSLGHNIGLAALSSGAVRYRFYSSWGLSGTAIAKLVVFCGVTVGLGLVTLGGIMLLIMPALSGRVVGVDPKLAQLLGGICLLIPVAYIALVALRTEPLRFRRWRLDLPALPIALAQVLIGTLNFALVAACLHQALNALSEVPYPAVASVYVLANAAAIVSHVPGGLGVIEAAVVFLLPSTNALAAALLFRFAYYLVPLPFGVAALIIAEFVQAHGADDPSPRR